TPGRAAEDGTHETPERFLVRGVVRYPARVQLGLARRLERVGLEAPPIRHGLRIVEPARWTRADERLVQQVLVAARWRRRVVDDTPVAAVHAAPAPHREPPRRRLL